MKDGPAPAPIASHDVAWAEWSEVPRIGVRYRRLTRAVMGDDYRVGVAIEELAPGRQSATAHYHILEEEHVFILEGAVTARIGTGSFAMTAGDYVCFPAGQKAGHCLLNTGAAPCRFVIVGEKNPNEVIVYPDSNKVLLRALGRGAIFDLGPRRGYWYGEDTGLPPGETPPASEPAPEPPVAAKPPVSAHAVDWQEEGVAGSTVFGGRSKHLTYAAVGDDYHVGLLIEAPAPGKRLCPTHYHMVEEEHALILEGEVTLILGDERLAMRPGDYVCFPAGRKVGHSFMNSGSGPCSYLMIGQRDRNDACVYPDSNKVGVSVLRSVLDLAAARDYWDGEATA